MGTIELGVVGLAGAGVGTALGLPMVWPSRPRSSDIRLIGGALIGLSVLAAIVSARVIGLVPSTPAVSHAVNLIGLASYPLLYLYIREQTGRTAPAFARVWLWLPTAAYVAVLATRGALGFSTRVPFAWILPVLLAFTVLCASMLVKAPGLRRDSVVPAKWLVTFLIALNVAQVVRMLFGHLPYVPALIPLVVTIGFAGLVGLVVWRIVERQEAVEIAATTPSYAKSTLDADAAGELLNRINRVLSTNRLFAEPNLTLARLAAFADSTAHQVSEVLNRYGATTFSELVNQHRIADVKAQLRDPASDGFTIEGIGASAGFGSRSTLYAAFRKIEGMTPAQFRERRRNGRD